MRSENGMLDLPAQDFVKSGYSPAFIKPSPVYSGRDFYHFSGHKPNTILEQTDKI